MSELLAPVVNTLSAPFWEGARAGRLMLPHCTATGRPFWPPSPLSPFAERSTIEWRQVEPRCVVRALGVYRRVFLRAFEAKAPYAIVLVELEDGVRLQAHVAKPDALAVGDTATLSFGVVIEGEGAVLLAGKADA